jgi:glutamyl-tRNA synthetase
MSDTNRHVGRLAPTPSGYLHIGHALTFHEAWQRARGCGLILRIEDLDAARCDRAYEAAIVEDLRWLGMDWTEGPDRPGPKGPYRQSERTGLYLAAWKRLCEGGWIYPSPHSRKDVERAISAPHEGEAEVIFPPALRPASFERPDSPGAMNWRFRVPDGRRVAFEDSLAGLVEHVAGRDFGDFVVWRRDGLPSYELAVVVDDVAMGIGEVVRGADLLLSTSRQILLYEALGAELPLFRHCPLVRDGGGVRLAKRSDSLSVRALRGRGVSPGGVLEMARRATRS